MQKLPIAYDVVASLVEKEVPADLLKALLLALSNEALAAMAAIMAIGRDVHAFPETEISTCDFQTEYQRYYRELSSDPLRSRFHVIKSGRTLGTYLREGLQAADTVGLLFVNSDEYWAQSTASAKTHPKFQPPHYQPPHSQQAEGFGMSGPAAGKAAVFTYQTRVTPTDEQDKILSAVRGSTREEVLKAEAYAGTGKTTLCEFVGEGMPQKATIYLAFNRVMANQAKTRLGHLMECRTTDSLAYLQVKPWDIWGEERTKSGQQVPWSDLADRLGLPTNFEGFKRGALVRQIDQTVKNYCNSDDQNLEAKHVPLMELTPGSEEQMVLWAQDLWARMLSKGEPIPVKPAQVMKVWDLKEGVVPFEHVLFDEAQDANGSFMSILRRSACQRILIGDHHQQLYEWRGAVDAMDKLSGQSYPLTQSFRFGPEIADYANRILSHKSAPPDQRLTGNEGIESQVKVYTGGDNLPEWPVTILSRTGVQVFYQAVDIAENGHRLHVVGGLNDLDWLLRDALKLFHGEPGQVRHNKLTRFRSWDSLVDEQEMTSDPELKRIRVIIEERHEILEKQLEVLHQHHEHDPERAPLILSTTHRVKGREWDRVMLLDDFVTPEKLGEQSDDERDAELNILYVAATRAVRELYIPASLRYGR